MKKNHVVINTNVFISSIIGQKSFPRMIFDEIVLTGEVKICLSKEVFAEYEEVINRDKFSKIKGFKERAENLLLAIKEIAFWFEPTEEIALLPDADDDMFIELAIEANALYIVTGNTQDFILNEFRGILIRSPKVFYEEWVSQNE